MREHYNFPWTPIGVKACCEVMEWYVICCESLYIMLYGLHTKQTSSAWWEHLWRQAAAYFHSIELHTKCSASDVSHNKEHFEKSNQNSNYT